MTDFHTHSTFSFDGTEPIENIVRAAIGKGIKTLAVTDHFEFFDGELSFTQDKLKAYITEITALKKQYAGQINLLCGLEVGYTKNHADQLADALAPHSFDYLINSVHEVNGIDCYFAEYFENKTKSRAYGDYLTAVLDSLDAPYPYHTAGHIGYVCRNSPYANADIEYPEFKELLDAILQKLITKDKFLEINPNIYGTARQETRHAFSPNVEILTAYKNMGGKKIIYGSDAHKSERLGDKYKEGVQILKNLGLAL